MRVKNFCTIVWCFNVDTISCDDDFGFTEMEKLEELTGVRTKDGIRTRRLTHHELFELQKRVLLQRKKRCGKRMEKSSSIIPDRMNDNMDKTRVLLKTRSKLYSLVMRVLKRLRCWSLNKSNWMVSLTLIRIRSSHLSKVLDELVVNE